MNFSRFADRVKKAGFYIPFTFYFLVFAAALFICQRTFLQDQTNGEFFIF